MKVYEKLGIKGRCVTKDEMSRAEVVYGRYLKYCEDRDKDYKPMSLAEFLLRDADYDRYDCFMWPKGELVKTKEGSLGMTTGWTVVGFASTHFAVTVKTAKGEDSYDADDLQKADVPPEVLEYVKSTLQDRVHGKVDEAFKEG